MAVPDGARGQRIDVIYVVYHKGSVLRPEFFVMSYTADLPSVVAACGLPNRQQLDLRD
jgi:hypothetical protein